MRCANHDTSQAYVLLGCCVGSWQLGTDLSGQPVGAIFKCQDGTSITNYQSTPRNTPKSEGLNYIAVEALRPAR